MVFLLKVLLFLAGGIYPLNSKTRGRDVGLLGNQPGRVSHVRYIKGPDGVPGTGTYFFGRRNSYIEFRNTGRLDTQKSMTMLVWIKNQGGSGPIFNYNRRGWGVHFWMVSSRTLFVRFNRRGGRAVTPLKVNIRPGKWQYVGATYNGRTGVAKLFVNNRFVRRRRIGRFKLATNQQVRMGAKPNDRRYLRGGLSCMQVYNRALTGRAILGLKKRCFLTGKFLLCFFFIEL